MLASMLAGRLYRLHRNSGATVVIVVRDRRGQKDSNARMTHSIDWTLWELLLIAATLEIIGDLAFKWWAETNCWLGLSSDWSSTAWR